MGFFKRLFNREPPENLETGYSDPSGIYLYVKCDHCGTCVKVRADKKYDLENTGNGYIWHKTIVDNKCFRRMQTVVQFDRKYAVTSTQLDGGKYITRAEFEDWLAAQEAAKPAGKGQEALNTLTNDVQQDEEPE